MLARRWLAAVAALLLILVGIGPVQGAGTQECAEFEAPTPLTPRQKSTLSSTEVTFTWTAVAGAETYGLEIIPDDHPGSIPEITVSGTQHSLSLPGGHTYSWNVYARAVESGCPNGDRSGYIEFTISPQILPPGEINAVEASQGDYYDRTRISGFYARRADYYKISRTDPVSHETVLLGYSSENQFFDFYGEVGKEYVYTVEACNAGGCGPGKSATGWVGSCQPVVGTPELVSPANGAFIIYDPGIYQVAWLDWQDLAGVEVYQVQIFQKGTHNLLKEDFADRDSGLSFTEEVGPSGDVEWRVRGLNPVQGCPAGMWSERWWFHYQPDTTSVPVGLQASRGTYADRVVLTWQMPPGDDLGRIDFFDVHRLKIGDYLTNEEIIARVEFPPYELTYTDNSAQPGVVYLYWVEAYGHQQYSSDSPIELGWAGQTNIYLPLVGR